MSTSSCAFDLLNMPHSQVFWQSTFNLSTSISALSPLRSDLIFLDFGIKCHEELDGIIKREHLFLFLPSDCNLGTSRYPWRGRTRNPRLASSVLSSLHGGSLALSRSRGLGSWSVVLGLYRILVLIPKTELLETQHSRWWGGQLVKGQPVPFATRRAIPLQIQEFAPLLVSILPILLVHNLVMAFDNSSIPGPHSF
jgi:hypothetical protein